MFLHLLPSFLEIPDTTSFACPLAAFLSLTALFTSSKPYKAFNCTYVMSVLFCRSPVCTVYTHTAWAKCVTPRSYTILYKFFIFFFAVCYGCSRPSEPNVRRVSIYGISLLETVIYSVTMQRQEKILHRIVSSFKADVRDFPQVKVLPIDQWSSCGAYLLQLCLLPIRCSILWCFPWQRYTEWKVGLFFLS